MIKGCQFGTSQGDSTVRSGGIDLECPAWSDTKIQRTAPATASSGPGTVVTDTWTSNDTVTITILPQITSVSPSSGSRGSTVQIVGTNFGSVMGKVKLGAVPATVTQWGDTSISFTVPANMPPGTYAVTVIDWQGKSVLKGAFTVVK